MQLHGFQKTTLLDYPGHVACTVFTGHCNFRCPFCHNMELVLHPGDSPLYPEEEIFAFLKKRQGILDGIAITGGEPTLQPDLSDFMAKTKDLGYAVKLDTNGYRPDVLEEILKRNLADYVAMDIKSSPEGYARTCGLASVDTDLITRSIELLRNSGIDYEFRTTVVRELHRAEDFVAIGPWIEGAPAYYLQSFKDSEAVPVSGLSAYSKEELEVFADLVRPYVGKVEIRGVD